MSKIEELFNQFLDIEKKFDLFEFTIDGVFFWELLRVAVFEKIFRQNTGFESASVKSSSDRIRYYVSGMLDITHNPLLMREQDVLFIGTPRRMLLNDGYWWDIYTDPIVEQLDIPSATIEYSIYLSHMKPPRTKNLGYFDFIDSILAIDRNLGLTNISLKEDEMNRLVHLSSSINDVFGVQINIPQMVKEKLRARAVSLKYYLCVLKRINPKICVIVTSYGKEVFIEAAKMLNIPVAELQHGIISPFHCGYSFPGSRRTKQTFPDYLLVFGEYWKNTAHYPIKNHRVRSVGYPFLEEQKQRYNDLEKRKQVVVVSQPTVGQSLSKVSYELSQMSDFDYDIIYKLHPLEYSNWKKRYPYLIDSDVQVIDSSKTQIHEFFAQSKAQIGVYSTAIFEGLAFNLHTILLDVTGVGHVEFLAESSGISLARKSEEIARILNNAGTDDIDSESFFASDAKRNIIEFIQGFVD